MVRSSDANGVAVITQVDPMSVVFTIPQDVLPKVLQRLTAGEKPPVDAWDREQKVLLAKGFLLSTDNQIDVATGTVKLKAQFANPQGTMFPNQFVNVRMVIDTLKGVVVVPAAAIQRGNQGTVVYVVKEDNSPPRDSSPPSPRDSKPASVSSPTASIACAKARRSRSSSRKAGGARARLEKAARRARRVNRASASASMRRPASRAAARAASDSRT
jgi:multidrug efflux pump subunit AcrA (membrane-fusion protein)